MCRVILPAVVTTTLSSYHLLLLWLLATLLPLILLLILLLPISYTLIVDLFKCVCPLYRLVKSDGWDYSNHISFQHGNQPLQEMLYLIRLCINHVNGILRQPLKLRDILQHCHGSLLQLLKLLSPDM